IFDFSRRGVKRLRFDGARQFVAVAVINNAAHRAKINCRLLLAFGAGAQRIMIFDLQLDEPVTNHHHPEDHQDLNDDKSLIGYLVVRSHHGSIEFLVPRSLSWRWASPAGGFWLRKIKLLQTRNEKPETHLFVFASALAGRRMLVDWFCGCASPIFC